MSTLYVFNVPGDGLCAIWAIVTANVMMKVITGKQAVAIIDAARIAYPGVGSLDYSEALKFVRDQSSSVKSITIYYEETMKKQDKWLKDCCDYLKPSRYCIILAPNHFKVGIPAEEYAMLLDEKMDADLDQLVRHMHNAEIGGDINLVTMTNISTANKIVEISGMRIAFNLINRQSVCSVCPAASTVSCLICGLLFHHDVINAHTNECIDKANASVSSQTVTVTLPSCLSVPKRDVQVNRVVANRCTKDNDKDYVMAVRMTTIEQDFQKKSEANNQQYASDLADLERWNVLRQSEEAGNYISLLSGAVNDPSSLQAVYKRELDRLTAAYDFELEQMHTLYDQRQRAIVKARDDQLDELLRSMSTCSL
jgi:hypothetical protein